MKKWCGLKRSRVRNVWEKVGQPMNQNISRKKKINKQDKAGFLLGTSVKALLCGCVWRHETVTDTYSYRSLLGLLRGDCIYWEEIYMFTILNKNENDANHLGGPSKEAEEALKIHSRNWNWLLWLPVLPSLIGEGYIMAQGHVATTSMVPAKKTRAPVFPFLRFVHSFLSLTVMERLQGAHAIIITERKIQWQWDFLDICVWQETT